MQEEMEQLNRRIFLKLSGAAAVGLAGSKVYPQTPEAANTGTLTSRSAPVNPIVLRSAELEGVLDRHDGLPYEYRLLGGNRRGLRFEKKMEHHGSPTATMAAGSPLSKMHPPDC